MECWCNDHVPAGVDGVGGGGRQPVQLPLEAGGDREVRGLTVTDLSPDFTLLVSTPSTVSCLMWTVSWWPVWRWSSNIQSRGEQGDLSLVQINPDTVFLLVQTMGGYSTECARVWVRHYKVFFHEF